jgi:hypothetical protein
MGGKNGCELVISAATISDEESESSQKRDEPPLPPSEVLGKLVQDTSEFRPAAAVSEAIMRLVPGLSCDIRSLLIRAKTCEQDLRKLRAEGKSSAINLYR